MGLAGPRSKQRIGLDPQNRAWKDDKSKFGLKMMQKMGWTEGKGLGVNEDGQKEHVKVRLKENNLGLGADRRTIDNWLDNNSAFDALLKGMAGNEDVAAGGETTTTTTTTVETVAEQTPPAAVSGRLYHRQKFRRNKAVSGFNAEQLSMILGVKHTPAVAAKETSPEAESPSDAIKDDPLLRVAATTVQDYFAQKMAARGLAPSVAARPAAETEEEDEDDYDAPPSFGGLGLGATSQQPATAAPPPAAHYMSSVGFTMGGPGLSSFIKTVDVSVTETLMQATSTLTAANGEDEQGATSTSTTPSKASEKAAKRARKEQARAEKAERKQKRAEKRALKAASSKLPTPAESPSQKPAELVPQQPAEEPLTAPAVKQKKKSKKEKALADEPSLEQLDSGKKRRREEDEKASDPKPKSKKEKKEKTEKKEKMEKKEEERKRAKAKKVKA
ncbi:PIN2/TERF1-interacting telomerase inhibitor 1 [Geranomyces variabilis]|uniref:PIN2/TERF1-interacting telomerase inhibitor 1 n=1 Tax=Geranomyces variabilis TaxID=109894 RepID=A0AAD5TPQ9_9FUNG|nr:PIN2/TERF1-interacting telomerase inhibitor 1 [Geranomyces variabilis]